MRAGSRTSAKAALICGAYITAAGLGFPAREWMTARKDEVRKMAEKTFFKIMLDMFDGKASVDETTERLYEAFYGKPCTAEEAKEARGDDDD